MNNDGRFTHAIVRPPGASFVSGLTREDLGAADVAQARQQHSAYCDALRTLGLSLTVLPPDEAHPDSTFVEDTAVVLPRVAVITRPGASSRAGEVHAIRAALGACRPLLHAIEAPGTVDGGDICEAGEHVLIGISKRTNEDGAHQLATLLEDAGYTTATVDLRELDCILHLKSGLTWLGGTRFLAIAELARDPALRGFDVQVVQPEDTYASNAVLMNGRVLVAAGYPRVTAQVREFGLDTIELEMGEFRKMDGGLSCLSLRFDHE